MTRLQSRHLRVLGIAPSTRGFGFAVLEGEETLVDWGATEVKHEKNAETLAKVERLITHYQPDVLVLPDALQKKSRRSPRIKSLCQEIATLAETRKIKVKTISNNRCTNAYLEK